MVKVISISKYRLQVIEDFERNGIKVEKGFIFDGASIPRPLWFLFHPFQYLDSSVIHDKGYQIATRYYSIGLYKKAKEAFELADYAFLSALKEDDPKVSRLFYNFVRLCRYFKFRKSR